MALGVEGINVELEIVRAVEVGWDGDDTGKCSNFQIKTCWK